MEVMLIDKFYGYCPGLKRSLKIADHVADEAAKEGKKIYFDVPLAHNENVTRNLQKRGYVKVELDENIQGEKNLFLISAHGASGKKIYWLRKHNFIVRSGTCPTVRRVQDQARADYRNGYQIVIFGKKDHAEVVGINGSANNSAIIAKDLSESESIELTKKTSVICQTTYPSREYKEFVEILKKNNPEIELVVRNTICPVVEYRINQVVSYVNENKPDLVVVVGSKTSSNTKQLAHTVSEHCDTVMIDDESEISKSELKNINKVLVVSGTSAPPEVVEAVAEKLRSF